MLMKPDDGAWSIRAEAVPEDNRKRHDSQGGKDTSWKYSEKHYKCLNNKYLQWANASNEGRKYSVQKQPWNPFLIQEVLKSDQGIWVCIFYGLVTENDDANETTEQESSFQANVQTELEKVRAPLSYESNHGIHLYLM